MTHRPRSLRRACSRPLFFSSSLFAFHISFLLPLSPAPPRTHSHPLPRVSIRAIDAIAPRMTSLVCRPSIGLSASINLQDSAHIVPMRRFNPLLSSPLDQLAVNHRLNYPASMDERIVANRVRGALMRLAVASRYCRYFDARSERQGSRK